MSAIQRSIRFTGLIVMLLLLVGLSPVVAAGGTPKGKGPGDAPATVDVQILAVNDVEGNISTGRDVDDRAVGGAAYLQAYIDREEQENPRNTFLLHAGDAVGASPPVSALLQDEPTIDVLNQMNFDLGVVGNHEFDEGVDEMFRLIDGGCHPETEPVTGCFEGVDFPMLAANVVWEGTDETILPPYEIVNFKGARIGFIGIVTTETYTKVIPGALDGVEILDEADAVNKYVAELRGQRVEAIVVLSHLGGEAETPDGPITGRFVEFVDELDDAVDVVISGDSHQGYVNTIDGKLVTQAYAHMTALTDIDLTIDRITGDVVAKSAELIDTWNDAITPDPEIAALVAEYEEIVAPLIEEVVGTVAGDLSRTQNDAGESELGNLIADAQRWKTGADFAFMNPGGIRADIQAGEVTYGELFIVQPFGNDLITRDYTGEQIYTLLNQQWQESQTRFLQISGLEYDHNGSSVVEVRLPDGTPIDRAATYSVTINSFLAAGGDGFTVLTEGANEVFGGNDLDALIEYIEQLPQPFGAEIEGRINLVP